MNLLKTKEGYQTEPKCGSGIGRFQVWATDNANARAIGKQPKWTVRDLYTMKRFQCDTLAEVKEECKRRERIHVEAK